MKECKKILKPLSIRWEKRSGSKDPIEVQKDVYKLDKGQEVWLLTAVIQVLRAEAEASLWVWGHSETHNEFK